MENLSHISNNQAKRLLQVSPRTVCKLFDTGVLRGFRVPGSTHRRIELESVLEIMASHGYPPPTEADLINLGIRKDPNAQHTRRTQVEEIPVP